MVLGCFFYEQLLTTIVHKVLIFNSLQIENYNVFLFHGIRGKPIRFEYYFIIKVTLFILLFSLSRPYVGIRPD